VGWPLAEKTFAFGITVGLVIVFAATLFYFCERPARTRLRDQLSVFEKM
jgi:peptidoglycan/LPS O-acetylase OafA/YrhL